jgi:aryl-alcohol dehydrogenase-like predicted oxidoreductase
VDSKIILGTVQFGLNYGINNSLGKPSESEVFSILDTAWENNIAYLDTADAYGDAIQIIGKYHNLRNHRFKILSKFKEVKLGHLKEKAIIALNYLHVDYLEVYSFHSFNDFLASEYLCKELLSLKEEKLIIKTGISVYTNIEFEKAINSGFFDVIQIPYNVLDNSNIRGILIESARKKGIEVHTRSAFLQGLFFMNKLPQKLIPLENYIEKIKSLSIREAIPIQELALSYCVYNPLINNVLIGVDTKEQLLSNLINIREQKDAFDFIDKNILVKEIELLNPVNWK